MIKKSILICYLAILIVPCITPPPFSPDYSEAQMSIENLRECVHFTKFAPSAYILTYHYKDVLPHPFTTHDYWHNLYTTFKGPLSECHAAYSHYSQIRNLFDTIEPILKGYKNSCKSTCELISFKEYKARRLVLTTFNEDLKKIINNIQGIHIYQEEHIKKIEERVSNLDHKSIKDKVRKILDEEEKQNNQFF